MYLHYSLNPDQMRHELAKG